MVESKISDVIQSVVDFMLEHTGKAVKRCARYFRLQPRHQQA